MSREWDEGVLASCDDHVASPDEEECDSEQMDGRHEDGLKSYVHILRFQDSKKEINRAHTLWRSAC